jgi:hypothetical protein
LASFLAATKQTVSTKDTVSNRSKYLREFGIKTNLDLVLSEYVSVTQKEPFGSASSIWPVFVPVICGSSVFAQQKVGFVLEMRGKWTDGDRW